MHTDADGFRADSAPPHWPFAPLRPDQVARLDRDAETLRRRAAADLRERAEKARRAILSRTPEAPL